MNKILFILQILISFSLIGNAKVMQDSILKTVQYSSDSAPDDPLVPQMIPLSPQSAIYQKYLNHKIKEYTGTPEIQIPLYEIQIRGMNIPIVLSYHASGIKAHQYDGDVGAGWSLNVGGFKVMRSVFGKEDEMITYGKYSYSAWKSNYVNIDGSSTAQKRIEKDSYLDRLAIGSEDGEYDHFSYILPSTSGSFILLDGNKENKVNALIAENSRDKLLFSDGNGVYSFRNITIIDEQGFIYQMDKDNKEFASNNTTVTGWPLAKILSPYGDEVHFEYLKYESMYNEKITTHFSYNEAPFYTNWITDDPLGPQELTGDRISYPFSTTYRESSSLLVDKITAPNCKIKFIRRGPPLLSGQHYRWNQLITDIEVYNNSDDLIRKIHFDYDLATEYGPNRHNLLKTIVISGSQPSPEEKYDCLYYPSYTNAQVTNEWGYGGNGTWFHELFETYPPLLYKKKRSGIDEYFQFEFTVSSSAIKGFGDRSAKTNPTTNEYSLQKIVFPTGGFTEYEYEPHEDDSGSKVGGLRIKRIVSKVAENSLPIITEYQYEDAKVESHLAATDFAEELYNLNFFDQVGATGIPNIAYRGSRKLIFSIYPIQEALLSSTVKYGKVTIIQYDQEQNKNNGKTVKTYGYIPYRERREIPQRAYFTPFSEDGSINLRMPNNTFGRGFWINSYLGYEPVLTSCIYYDRNGEIKKEESYNYSNVNRGIFNELKVKNKISIFTNTNLPLTEIYKFISSRYDYIEYELNLGFYRLENKNIKDYTDSGIIEYNETYSYNERNQLKEKVAYPIAEFYNYPEDFNNGIYPNMVTANILSPIIEKIEYNLKFSRHEIGRKRTNYLISNNMYLPSSKQSKIFGDYQTDVTFDKYDVHGNIVQYTTLDGISTVLIWSYGGQYPIAEIKNATYNQLIEIINENTLNAISARIVPTESDWRLINNLRSNPAMVNTFISTYTYKPLIGMLTATDPSGITVYYEYDTLGRLLRIKDDAGKVVEEYNYHYSK